MKALYLDENAKLTEVPRPRPAQGEALVRVTTVGICNTDLEIMKGYMNFSGILGHEFVGVVENAATEDLIGKRVVGEINCSCHECEYCRKEMPNHCLNRTVLGILNRNGAFAEYLTLPEENLHIVPDSVSDDSAVFAEPLAAAFRITEQLSIDNLDKIVVLGAGKLGQLISQVLHQVSRNVVSVGRNQWKLELLKELGIRTVHTNEPMERGYADIVVDATGSYDGFNRALELVRPEGTVILKTTVTHPTAFDMSIPVINEVRVMGSRCGPFRPALNALEEGNIIVSPMVTESYELKDIEKALVRASQKDVMKVLVHM